MRGPCSKRPWVSDLPMVYIETGRKRSGLSHISGASRLYSENVRRALPRVLIEVTLQELATQKRVSHSVKESRLMHSEKA